MYLFDQAHRFFNRQNSKQMSGGTSLRQCSLTVIYERLCKFVRLRSYRCCFTFGHLMSSFVKFSIFYFKRIYTVVIDFFLTKEVTLFLKNFSSAIQKKI